MVWYWWYEGVIVIVFNKIFMVIIKDKDLIKYGFVKKKKRYWFKLKW